MWLLSRVYAEERIGLRDHLHGNLTSVLPFNGWLVLDKLLKFSDSHCQVGKIFSVLLGGMSIKEECRCIVQILHCKHALTPVGFINTAAMYY